MLAISGFLPTVIIVLAVADQQQQRQHFLHVEEGEVESLHVTNAEDLNAISVDDEDLNAMTVDEEEGNAQSVIAISADEEIPLEEKAQDSLSSALATLTAGKSHSQVAKTLPPSSFLGVTTTSKDPKEANLIDWMRANGAKGTDGMRMQMFLKGDQQVRGLAATKAFKKDEIVLSIPEKILFHTGDEKATKVDDLRLMLVAEKRKGSASFWAPFIQSLPSPEDYEKYYPTFMDEVQLQHYIGLPPVRKIVDRQNRLKSLLKLSRQLVSERGLSELSDLSLDELRWADAVSISRRFHSTDYESSTGKEQHGMAVIVPFADLALHADSDQKALSWKSHMENGAWLYRATRDIKPGDELSISYGRKNNEQFLLSYGFVLPGNPTKLSTEREGCTTSAELLETKSNALPTPFFGNLQTLREEYCKT